MKTVCINTSSFAVHSDEPLKILREKKYEIEFNTTGRKLNQNELCNLIKMSDGVIAGTEKYTRDILARLPYLKVISRLGIGMDNVDLKAVDENGIKVFKTKTNPAPAVAELVLGLMIDVVRNISKSSYELKKGEWKKHMGSLLQGKTLGIIGLGNIGKALVKLVRGFGFKVIAYDLFQDEDFMKEYDITYCELNTLMQDSDIISLHLSLSDKTQKLVNKDRLALMKQDAILINTSRGEIIDEEDLFAALKSNKLAGAGLDVFEQEPYAGPLTELNNIVITPHIGAYAKEIRNQMEIEAAENLIRGLNK